MKHERPVLLHRSEIERAVKILEETNAPFVAFHEYELGEGAPIVPTGIAEEMRAIADGTHPMFSQEYVKNKLEQIMKDCEELGIVYKNRPMHEVMIELNAKKNNARKLPPKAT